MARADKAKRVERMLSEMSEASVMYLMDFQGLTVAEITDLRRRLNGAGAALQVVKNTLARRAAAQASLEGMNELLTGPSAVVYCRDDAAVVAKVIQSFIREKRKAAIKGGFLEQKSISVSQVEQMATLPSREELLAQVVSGIAGPLYGLATVLNGPIRGLVVAMDRVREQKAQEAA